MTHNERMTKRKRRRKQHKTLRKLQRLNALRKEGK